MHNEAVAQINKSNELIPDLMGHCDHFSATGADVKARRL